MANFLENRPPQFNPYVQQLPTEAYVSVGTTLQGRYNEGIQKIQTQIDNVAGLDIIRDVDKQYLQSKMNTLGNNLKTVAAGDFSNFQLVNSVGGMINQIGKDANIQNAVGSTQRVRQQQELMKDAQKNGKSSPNREYDFNNELNSWFNDKQVGKKFDGQFREHVDVNKKVLEIIGKLHPNSNIQDIPFAVNSDGTPNYKIIADAMQRRGETEVNEGQIKTAVSSMLEASDLDELGSQGRYNYKNHNIGELQTEATRTYNLSKVSAKDRLDKLQRQLLTVTDIGQQTTINDSINYYKSLLGSDASPGILDETHRSILQSISNDPDGARASLYTRNWLNEIGNGFSYKEIKNEVIDSPLKENFWKTKNYELDQLKERHTQDYRDKQLNIEERKLSAEEKKNAPYEPYFKTKGNTSTNNLTSLQDFTTHNKSLVDENLKAVSELAVRASTPTTKVLPSDILKRIEEYKTSRYIPKSTREKEKFDNYIKNSNFIANQEELYKTYENEAYKEITGGITEVEHLNQKLQNLGSLKIAIPGGGTAEFSPKEIYNYLNKESLSTSSPYGSALTPTSNFALTINESQIVDSKERLLRQTLSKRYEPTYGRPGGSSGMPLIDKYLSSFIPIIDETKNTREKVLKLVAEKMAPITGEFSTKQASIGFKNADAKENFIRDLTNIAQADLGENTGGEKYDPEKTLKLLTKNGGVDVESQFVKQGGKYFIQLTNKNNSSDIELMPVDQDFVNKNQSLGSKFLNENLDLADIMLRNNNSTNIFQDYNHSYYNSGKFGGYDVKTGNRTVTLPISCDLENDGGQLYPIFKLKTKNGDIIKLQFPLPIDYSRFETEYLPSMTNDKLIELFKTRFPNIEQLISK